MSEQVIPETRKGSWFGSISRKRRRKDTAQLASETLAAEEPPTPSPGVEPRLPPQNASPTASDNPQQISLSVQEDPVELPTKTPLENAPPSLHTTPLLPSGPPNVQGVLPKPTHLDVLSSTTSISSVDDVVPQLKTLPDISIPVLPQNPIPSTVGGVGDVATTNVTAATTSRFTLRIPLLGRPKMPLNQAMAVAQAEDIRNSASPTPVNEDSTPRLNTPTTEEAQRPDLLAVPSNTSA